jgi:hypothetical protein
MQEGRGTVEGMRKDSKRQERKRNKEATGNRGSKGREKQISIR